LGQRAQSARGGLHVEIAARGPCMVDGWARQLVTWAGAPFNAVIDGTGGPALNDFVRMLAPGGVIALYGATVGPCDRLNVTYLFLKACAGPPPNPIERQRETVGVCLRMCD
jgi:NADPH:quinone reductase-like Zn-dependent oxidoreductase